ncbi:MAG: aminoglycoside phosphotransferase family protein [Anaerolineae bacterium]|nr:aminoglycoside phosphotransferase family protein [Anaerolineae bacterium]
MLLPVIETWKQWGAIFTDVAQWTPAVREICRREGIAFGHIEAGYPGTNAVFVLDGQWVVKIYAPFCHADFDLERTLYPLLSEMTHIPSPRLLAEGVLEDAMCWPYIVMDFRPGQPIREVRAQISPENRVEVAASLGAMTHELHGIPLARVARVENPRNDWPAFRRQRLANCLTELETKAGLSALVLDEMIAFVAVQTSTESAPVMLVNGDLTEDHVLLEEQGGRWRVSGLLDFADALIAPRAYEWIALWFGALDQRPDEFAAFMRSYDPVIALDDTFFQEALLFTFLHQFGAGIIAHVLKKQGHPPPLSLADLKRFLWRQ